MEHEGMVHALESIHRLLKAHGTLLDLHPVPDVALIKVLNSGKLVFSELYPSQSGDDFRAADRAIDLTVQEGLFHPERTAVFDFLTYASSTAELNDFLQNAGAYDQRPPEGEVETRRSALYARVDQIIHAGGPGAEPVYHEKIRITHLKPMA